MNIKHLGLSLVVIALTTLPASAATLASATYDTDSYVFIGTNNWTDVGVSTFPDVSGGVLDANESHFNFAVIKFDDLTGIDTVTNGGPSKFLTLETLASGNAVVAFSVAGDDVQNGYPSTSGTGPGAFNGPGGGALDRLQWYFDNIKGDDANYGGYAGSAEHIGVLNLGAQGTYSLDVTSIVDAWIDGSVANNGFGVWAPSTSGGQGSPLDFASLQNPVLGNPYYGPLLTSIAVPEPTSVAMALLSIAAMTLARRRRKVGC